LLGAALLAASALHAGPSRADDKQMCVDAHVRAQRLRHGGQLLGARQELLACARATCPAIVAGDCAMWLNEVNAEVPSIVVVAHDDHGTDMIGVRVKMDGVILASKLDGRPIDVDPGEHVFRYELEDGRAVEATVVVSSSDKARPLRIDFPAFVPGRVEKSVAPEKSAPPAESVPPHALRRGVPVAGVIVGAVGVAGLAVFTGLGVDGYSRERHLATTCGSGCSPAQVSSVETEYHAADVSLAVGAVALGAAAWITLSHVLSKEGVAPPASPSAVVLRFAPLALRGGGGGMLAGAF
jgi:hypothetical protein